MLWTAEANQEPVHKGRPVTGRLKPAHEVFHQIMHDEKLQLAIGGLEAVVVGYHDRFLGTLECPFQEFAQLDIPFHRVRHYRSSGIAIFAGWMWDRHDRINNLNSLRCQGAL